MSKASQNSPVISILNACFGAVGPDVGVWWLVGPKYGKLVD